MDNMHIALGLAEWAISKPTNFRVGTVLVDKAEDKISALSDDHFARVASHWTVIGITEKKAEGTEIPKCNRSSPSIYEHILENEARVSPRA